MRQLTIFLVLVCIFALVTACGSRLDKHSAGLILAEYSKGKILLEIDLWSDFQDSVGDFVICDPNGKVVLVRASFSGGKVSKVLRTQIIEGVSCAAPPK